jgi:hypothetical protein
MERCSPRYSAVHKRTPALRAIEQQSRPIVRRGRPLCAISRLPPNPPIKVPDAPREGFARRALASGTRSDRRASPAATKAGRRFK